MRPNYHRGYFAAFLKDPEGNRIEAVFHNASGSRPHPEPHDRRRQPEIKLGLIGVGIERSRAPELHRLAGELCGIAITYDLFSLKSGLPADFDGALAACRSRGYRGVNVTHPFKERAAQVVEARPSKCGDWAQ